MERNRQMEEGSAKEENGLRLKTIAYIHTDFPAKFGIPRQSGLADTRAEIVFEGGYGNQDACKGIEEYSHLWLIWGFTEVMGKSWSPTVRPPRLGGNKRVGVFASRSPFRPNPVGLSCVALERVENRAGRIVLHVRGADLMDGTPIYDIKPYLPYADCHADAEGGFAEQKKEYGLDVEIPGEWMDAVPAEHREILVQILSQDPRPSYQKDPDRIYGMEYAGMDVRFRVSGNVLKVCGISQRPYRESGS